MRCITIVLLLAAVGGAQDVEKLRKLMPVLVSGEQGPETVVAEGRMLPGGFSFRAVYEGNGQRSVILRRLLDGFPLIAGAGETCLWYDAGTGTVRVMTGAVPSFTFGATGNTLTVEASYGPADRPMRVDLASFALEVPVFEAHARPEGWFKLEARSRGGSLLAAWVKPGEALSCRRFLVVANQKGARLELNLRASVEPGDRVSLPATSKLAAQLTVVTQTYSVEAADRDARALQESRVICLGIHDPPQRAQVETMLQRPIDWDKAKADYERARKVLVRLLGPGPGDAMRRALRALEAGRTDDALPLLEKAAAAGDASAYGFLGEFYGKGEKVDRDLDKAAKCLALAAEDEYPDAQAWLGSLLAQPGGDGPAAVAWFRKAAAHGVGKAAHDLALIYANGHLGIPVDHVKAFGFAVRAADAGDMESAMFAAAIYARREDRGAAADEKKAIACLRKAADSGLTEAQLMLGTWYEEGNYVEQDFAAARIWYERAALQGEKRAAALLGRIHAMGRGGAVDLPLAYAWFTLIGATAPLDVLEKQMTAEEIARGQALHVELQGKIGR